MPKNIIICCDGTGNQLGETYSNVVKLYMMLEKDNQKQLAFYDPGVGTMSDANAVNPLSKTISKIGGLAFGWGLKENVSQAYGYLMENYEPEDKIFMFGFSRGAYTVRVLAALIHTTGLLQKGCQHLIPYAWEIFRKSFEDTEKRIAAQFRDTYARKTGIHFMGVWDTVTSIGLFNRKKLPYTTNNPSILNIRHAVSIDERRTYYRQNLFGTENAHQDIKQVWFAGVHSDVGGSYPLNESGLSQLTLEWMIREAKLFELIVGTAKESELLHDSLKRGYSVPDINEEIHHSLSIMWWVLEFFPKWKKRGFPIYFPLGSKRRMFEDPAGEPLIPLVHESVLRKTNPASYVQDTLGDNKYIKEL